MKKRIIIFILCLSFLMLAVAPLGATAAAPTVTLPSLTEDSNCASYENSDNSKIYYYTGVSKSNFDSYVLTLKNEGYTEVKTYTADSCSCYYSLLDNGANTVFVSFLRSVSGSTSGRLRVFVQASGTSYHTQSEATTASVCEPMLWQLDVDNTGGDNGGMSYVIRLTDGTFVIIDGGYRTEKEAKNLYSVLASNNPLDGNPEVSAWFITHAHLDHYGILSQFTSMYSESVTVKGFYYNFPSENVGDIWSSNCKGIETEMKKWSGAKLYSKIHSGMVMGFAGATVEVLATHEDVKQSYYNGENIVANSFDGNGNNTSTVLRFNIAGQKIMFLADAETGVSNALTGTYTSSFLKSDIMQMAHHGFNDGVKSDLVEAIDPDVVLWPMDIIKYDNGVISSNYTNTFGEKYELTGDSDITEAKKASEIIPAYKNEALSLPYTKNTLYSGKTPDYATLRIAKTKILNATKDIYVQKSLDNSKIRFIGVLNLTEQELDGYQNVGFDISMIYNGTTYQNRFTTTTVYKSLMANGTPIYASAYGGTYFYAIEITDIDLADSDIEFIIEGTGTYKSGNAEYTLSYDVGRYIVTSAFGAVDSGEMPSVDFSDIISGAWREVTAQ